MWLEEEDGHTLRYGQNAVIKTPFVRDGFPVNVSFQPCWNVINIIRKFLDVFHERCHCAQVVVLEVLQTRGRTVVIAVCGVCRLVGLVWEEFPDVHELLEFENGPIREFDVGGRC